MKKSCAQAIIEYILLLSVITAAIVYMYPLVKRSTQSLIKVTADQIAEQQNAEQDFNSSTGYTVGANYMTYSGGENIRQHRESKTGYGVSQWSKAYTNVFSNQGFTEE